MRVIPAGRRGTLRTIYVLLAGALFTAAAALMAQSPAPTAQSVDKTAEARAALTGLPVRSIGFVGIDETRAAPLRERLPLQIGAPLTDETLARALRQVYASGLFETVDVEGQSENGGVALTFKGTPRTFIGTVSVYGARGATVNTQLGRASRLTAGTRFTQSLLEQAMVRMREVLADNGYHEPTITYTLTPMPGEQLVDIAFQVASGPQAHVGNVEVAGTPGMSVDVFRRYAHLRVGTHVDRDTVNRALSAVLKHYQKQNRLEADVKLEAQTYDTATKRIDYKFSATRGPVVQLRLTGAGLDDERLKRVIPIYEEGTVDDDLLNEGDRRIRDYYQRLGYFDIKVEHTQQTSSADLVTILYTVTLGARRKVERVDVDGNHYFDSQTLKDLLSVRAADTLDRHGLYSQSLVTSDISALVAAYQNNGFSSVKVTPETGMATESDGTATAKTPRKTSGLVVVYHIQEGTQQRVGTVTLDGNTHTPADQLLPLMNTAAGQLASPQSLAGDREALLTDYLSRGYDQAQVEVEQKARANDPNLIDVTFHITEGRQVFVRKVLLTGLHFTRPDTVSRAITLHPGDPLDQSALLETQRNLYEFALFNEVDTAVENPSGNEPWKTILVQTSEARRWTLTYGFGFETQTGTPQNNCAGYLATGTACNPNGKPGISPRLLMDVTRNNLFGREQSASIQGTYGLLEQKINLIYQNPHFLGHPNFGLSFTGGYANSQDVTTYVASKLNGGLRATEHFTGGPALLSRANTLVYFFDFRRVKVQGSSLQVYPAAISELAAAVRVAGPGLTWLRDTRDSPLDAHRGTYTSLQEFLSGHSFGSQAQFNRLDVSNSNFWSFDKSRFVLARNSRYAQERAFGEPSDELIPLPERLYSGGSTSLRGFSMNAAGPRDPETGYPVGGAGALVNSTELRLPPPTLPWLGDSVSFVLFHDMGNVFADAGDAWKSALRVAQPNRDTCKVLTAPTTDPNDPNKLIPPAPTGTATSTGVPGACSFNYFSHATGLGVRYHTPIGPIRLDFSYNLNPPIYPVNIDYSHSNPYDNQHVGQADHFNFFFSLGQTF